MRVMLMTEGDPEPGAVPSEELLTAMGRTRRLSRTLVDLAGLSVPLTDGSVSGGNRAVSWAV